MTRRNWVRRIEGAAVFVLVMALCGYAALSWQRYTTIRDVTAAARTVDSQGRVEALLAYLRSDATSFEEKNRAIWVLGELRDPAALDDLRALQRPGECDHERFICQREVNKAIAKIEGDTPNPYFWQTV